MMKRNFGYLIFNVRYRYRDKNRYRLLTFILSSVLCQVFPSGQRHTEYVNKATTSCISLAVVFCYCCDFPHLTALLSSRPPAAPPRSLRNNGHSSDSCSREVARAHSVLAIFLLPASSGFTSKFSISSSRGESTYLPICSNSICVVLFVRNFISLCRS